ncbi:MAG: DUF1599 domain-containing protein [Bacteroidaceae bacterium]|nr:DUF1599 domain-containing protein [Bacteroidaceae bacterium]
MTDPKKRFKEIMEEMNTLYQKKNADYGDSFHRAWKKFGSTVGLVYMDAKMNRITQLLAHPEAQQVHSEKIEDTLIDLANYAVLTIMEEQQLPYETALQLLYPIKNELKIILQVSLEENVQVLKDHIDEQHNFLAVGIVAIALMIQLEEKRKGEITSPVEEYGVLHLKDWNTPMYPNLQVPIVLEEGAVIPRKATEDSAGYDLFAPTNWIIMPGRSVIPLNFRMAVPKHMGAVPNPRSGFTLKGFEGYRSWKGDYTKDHDKLVPLGEPCRMNADVTWGLIDSDYRDVCGVLIISHEKEPFLLAKGTKFAQMCFQRYEDVDFLAVDKLDETGRSGGFGHTGTK